MESDVKELKESETSSTSPPKSTATAKGSGVKSPPRAKWSRLGSVCLLCLKSRTHTSVKCDLGKHHESRLACVRYVALISKYLRVDCKLSERFKEYFAKITSSAHVVQKSTLFEDELSNFHPSVVTPEDCDEVNKFILCDTCLPKAESFCALYEELELLRLRLQSEVYEATKIIDKSNESVVLLQRDNGEIVLKDRGMTPHKSLKKEFKNVSSLPNDALTDFRGKLKSLGDDFLKKSIPQVHLKRKAQKDIVPSPSKSTKTNTDINSNKVMQESNCESQLSQSVPVKPLLDQGKSSSQSHILGKEDEQKSLTEAKAAPVATPVSTNLPISVVKPIPSVEQPVCENLSLTEEIMELVKSLQNTNPSLIQRTRSMAIRDNTKLSEKDGVFQLPSGKFAVFITEDEAASSLNATQLPTELAQTQLPHLQIRQSNPSNMNALLHIQPPNPNIPTYGQSTNYMNVQPPLLRPPQAHQVQAQSPFQVPNVQNQAVFPLHSRMQIQIIPQHVLPQVIQAQPQPLQSLSQVVQAPPQVFQSVATPSTHPQPPQHSQTNRNNQSETYVYDVTRLQLGTLQCNFNGCGMGFSDTDQGNRCMYIHFKNAHRKIPCSKCSYVSKFPTDLIIHELKSHVPEDPRQACGFKCSRCSTWSSNLASHKEHFFQAHFDTKIDFLKCPECQKDFSPLKQDKLKKHFETAHCSLNAGSDSFRCHFCFAIFTEGRKLFSHMKIDHNINCKHGPHACPNTFCKEKFFNEDFVKLHLKMCGKVRCGRYFCPVSNCKLYPNGMLTQYNLTTHISNKHPEFVPFECSTCQQKFYCQKRWTDHLKVHVEGNSRQLSAGQAQAQTTLQVQVEENQSTTQEDQRASEVDEDIPQIISVAGASSLESPSQPQIEYKAEIRHEVPNDLFFDDETDVDEDEEMIDQQLFQDEENEDLTSVEEDPFAWFTAPL